MIAAQFELLKCGRELLSSPFRVSVHGGKEPVILRLILRSGLPRSSRFPPGGGPAPCENSADVCGNAATLKADLWGTEGVKASHGRLKVRLCFAFSETKNLKVHFRTAHVEEGDTKVELS